jgi:choline dehydrogenase-like flavoprotein
LVTLQNASLTSAIESAALEALDDRSAFDAIVVGGGAAGGMAAMLLSEAGMNVLLVDASQTRSFLDAPVRSTISRIVPWLATWQQRMALPASLTNAGQKALKLLGKIYQPIQSRNFAWVLAPQAFVDDRECPYETLIGTRFDWFRARQLGGRMVVPGHGGLYFRLGERDLSSWPLSPGDLDPWYDLVEERLGLAGMAENSPWAPDSRLREVIEPTAAEHELQELIALRWPGFQTILGRAAPPLASVAIAAQTGRLSLRCGAIVKRVWSLHPVASKAWHGSISRPDGRRQQKRRLSLSALHPWKPLAYCS